MKKIVFYVVFSVLFVWFVGCTSGKPVQTGGNQPQYDELQVLKDSVETLNMKVDRLTLMSLTYETYLNIKSDSIRVLTDSVNKLNQRPLMTKAQFLDLYKYDRLLKYYKICKARPVNWKYYRGWSIRVFEGED